MFVGAVFLGAGVALAALRKRAATKNECHDFPEFGLGKGLIKSCCSSTASLTGLLEAAQAEEILKGVAVTTTGGETQQEEPMCKFCDVTACCRFCFAGPEQGELCAPCLCVGTQVRDLFFLFFFRNAARNPTRLIADQPHKNTPPNPKPGARALRVFASVADGIHAHARGSRAEVPRV